MNWYDKEEQQHEDTAIWLLFLHCDESICFLLDCHGVCWYPNVGSWCDCGCSDGCLWCNPQEGIFKNKQEMVINMYNDKVPIEAIVKYANLTTKGVEDIINNK